MKALQVVSNRPARINPDVSDLFFNRDISHCRLHDGRVFAGYDAGKMIAEAADFADSLGRLGVDAGTPDDIVADFMARL